MSSDFKIRALFVNIKNSLENVKNILADRTY